jgi:hypothetical protein
LRIFSASCEQALVALLFVGGKVAVGLLGRVQHGLGLVDDGRALLAHFAFFFGHCFRFL